MHKGVDMKYSIVALTILMLLGGCDQPSVEKKEQNTPYIVQQTYPPPPPTKKIKLKMVRVSNFVLIITDPLTKKMKGSHSIAAVSKLQV